MASIRPLPEAVRSSVRSGIFLFDLARVVEELVFNSLDARATRVSVFVSIGSCYIKVVDDGGGITRDGLELVGERYATSKFLNLADLNATSGNFGFRGEALASISEVSLLEIVTRTYGRPNGYRKVLKGCKCLYLGIDDERKEVGTTVVVRDLFYNQPVRRKYMQSSPNKVLQSIKKCVLRLALVRPNISFKVVDIEREDELFCTHSATSPLALLTSGFGVEVTSSLHDLEVENDIIKLSGYVSGPYNTSNMKVLQYIYVNSQFVCKGPIHKLLSQMAIRFDHLNSWNTDHEFENKKRSRSQPCPAYILNLSCPRSLYDLTFEPSKTYVKFKDWAPILNFVEKTIKQFWEARIACESSCQATYMVQEDQQPWKADVNIISAEADISKFGNQNRKDCLDLFFSSSDKLTEDDYHQSNREDVGTTLGYSHQRTAMFKELQSKGDFFCQTGYSGNLLDGSYAKCMSTVLRKRDSLMMCDNNGLQGDYLLDGKFPAAESLYDNVPFDAPSSSHGRKFHKVDADAINESFESDLLYDCHGFSYDVEFSGDFQKPFLKSCSTRERSILHQKGCFVNDEHELQTDSFWSKQILRDGCGSGKDLYDHPCPEVLKKIKMSKDSDFLSRALAEENCLPPDSCYLATEIGSCGSDDQLLNSEWRPVYQEPISQATALGVYHTADINDLGEVSRHGKRICHTKLLDDEENECNFSYNMSRKADQHHCTSSFADTVFDFDGAVDCSAISDRLVDWPHCDGIYSTKRSDILNEEPDWLLPESCVRNCKRPNKNKGKRDHFRHPALEKNHKRSRRSFSAPPFHRSKKRFFCLNQTSEMIAKRPTSRATNLTFNHREASDFKYPQQSPGALHPSTEDLLLQEFKTNVKQRSDVLGDTEVNDITEIDGFGSFNIKNSAPFRELISREVQDSIDYRTKWRNCSPQIPKNDKLIDIQSQNSILDISSGFLHLAGDSLIPETISKKCLEDAKVLHQVDKKFIPVVASRTLAVIDQHAADERIRLEELRQKVLSGEAKAVTYLDAEQELVLPEIGYQLLHSYSEQVKDWGWICNTHAQNSESFKRNLDILNRQPAAISLISVPCILGVNLNDADLLEFLQQLADTDGSSTMPPSVIRVLNLKACRGAIMFGDSLLPSECSLLVEELKHTSLCFQCAHGRPTTVPLVNLAALHNQIAKLGLMNECSNDKWHGLRRHKVCIERAEQRLCSARGS
ncbi:DNA mismatch repair protein MLH3 isoform X2 [Gastrolobium bilobum]|uniref:DNA mismatch repair protein MLH3 isoform X2 n=1 Tax=Gastrolobium bilobum TaxID=150636 RepID=UPI002AB19BA0|nr:DNA mismatch repair protein MLH3 isoform X2 [Gastrolobium bilobum]